MAFFGRGFIDVLRVIGVTPSSLRRASTSTTGPSLVSAPSAASRGGASFTQRRRGVDASVLWGRARINGVLGNANLSDVAMKPTRRSASSGAPCRWGSRSTRGPLRAQWSRPPLIQEGSRGSE
jgi:hypothetical protein